MYPKTKVEINASQLQLHDSGFKFAKLNTL